MQQPPRPVGEGVLTPQMWRGIAFVGVIMAAGTLFALDISLPVASSTGRAVCATRRRWRSRR
jgi:Ca2+-transporting ATPase